jgi:lysophospholipase L1-like esterase
MTIKILKRTVTLLISLIMLVPAAASASSTTTISDSDLNDAIVSGLYQGVNAATVGPPADSLNTQIKNACGLPAQTFHTASGDFQDIIVNGLWTGINMATTGSPKNPGAPGCTVSVQQGSAGQSSQIIVQQNSPTTTSSSVTRVVTPNASATRVTTPNTSATRVVTPNAAATQVTTNSGTAAAVSTPAVSTNGAYVALGDSVAAGVGLPTMTPVPSNQTRCGRTQEAYPNMVAQTFNLPLVSAACSGATAGDLFTVQRTGSPNQPAQFDTAFASGTPRLISITAGANDAHWSQFALACYNTNCATAGQTSLANAYLVALQAKLLIAFTNINTRSGGNPPTVVITGYYNPISSACTSVFPNKITDAEVTWMTAEVDALNQTIQQNAAQFPNLRFAPVDFTGHDLCSTDSWVQGLRDKQPLHPTAVGQQAIADSVIANAQ